MDFDEINFSSNRHYHLSFFRVLPPACCDRLSFIQLGAGPRTYSRTRAAMDFAQLTSSPASTFHRPFSVSPAGSVCDFLKVADPQKLHQRVILRLPPRRHIFWTTPPPGAYLIPVLGSIVKEFITKYVNYIGPKQRHIYRPRGDSPASP